MDVLLFFSGCTQAATRWSKVVRGRVSISDGNRVARSWVEVCRKNGDNL